MTKLAEKTGKIVVISGPSGVGKGTINERLFADEKLRLVYSVSMTTRAPRPGETDGKNYHFVSKNEFEQAVQNGDLVEYAEFIGNYYGTPRKLVEEQTKQGKNVVLEIEVEGATQVVKKEKNVLSIFLMPPSFYELQQRIITRGTEGKEIIKQRLAKSLFEIPLKDNYQYVVQNDTVENAIAKVSDILIKEGLTDYESVSAYEKLASEVKEIILQDYGLFIEIIQENLPRLASIYKTLFTKDNFIDQLSKVITDRIYTYILAYGLFTDLEDHKKVQVLVNTNILEIDFFGVRNDLAKKF